MVLRYRTPPSRYELFNQVGPVASIRVCRDKITKKSLGYGYVNFHNVKDAETALDSLSYTSIHGRSCRLMWSQKDAGQRKANNSNVYVANLDKNIDNKALHDTFSVFGEIRSCKVAADLMGNSYGYGFVHFETEEAAMDAIQRLNNVEVGGQRIQVCLCENRKEAALNGADDFTNLYVKCFPAKWDEEFMRREFGRFGRLTGVAVRTDGQGRRSAFVNYEEHEDAKRCIQEMHMKDMRSPEEQDLPEEVGSDGHPLCRLYVQRAQPKSERERILKKQFAEDAAIKAHLSKISLYVKGLHDDMTDEGLRRLFEPFGTVLSASAPMDINGKCRGFGFVNFGSLEEATKAVSQMHLRVVHGRPIHVDLAESKKDRQARQQRAQQRFGEGMPGLPGGRGFPMGGFGMPRPGAMFAPMNMGPPMIPRGGCGPCGGGSMPIGFNPGAMGLAAHMSPMSPAPNMGMRPPVPPMSMGYGGFGRGQGLPGPPAARGPPGPQFRGPTVTAATLASMPPPMQKQLLGEKLYAEIARMNAVHAGKITGMMLEMDNSDILAFLESPERLQSKVKEALDMLSRGP
ncbi:pab1 [Symbiodinium pilosum]|uniref:Pab1 protein n=1 Tax=Symbiodinium pilosum TaxID=2952 RepID=A0A812X0K6_SYMPI|nr:pab1 [Symbiodinium pilosum]